MTLVENSFLIQKSFPVHSFSSFVCDKNMNQFMASSEIYHTDTRQHANFHQPSMNLTKYQKGVYYLVVKVCNMLPSDKKKKSLIIPRNLN